MIPFHKITHRGGARTQVLPFGGQETPVLQADGMGIGVADGKRNHGFSCLAYIDGNGGDAGCLAFTGLHCVGEKVAQYGAEVRIRQGEGFGQGDGGLHSDALVPGQMDVVIQNGVGGNIGTVLDCGKGFKTAQVFIDVFQGAVRFLFLQKSFYGNQVMAVVVPCFLQLVQIVLKGSHLGGLYAGKETRGPVLLAGSIALGQPGKYP